MLRLRLERAGYDVEEAVDGGDSVAQVQAVRPDLIVMDISMPGMDGIEAWRMMEDLGIDRPPAIAVTAVCISDVRLACLEAGFSAYLAKPINFTEMLRTIEKCLITERAA
jgi:hypothetical protein